jgi:hypothetical protein
MRVEVERRRWSQDDRAWIVGETLARLVQQDLNRGTHVAASRSFQKLATT